MKKRIILIILVISMVAMTVVSFTGCAVPLVAGTEMEILQAGVQAALDAEFYFYDEIDNRNENDRVNRSVNISGETNDKNEPTLDGDNNYIDYTARVHEFHKKPDYSSEVTYKVGTTKTSESILTFNSKIKTGKDEDKLAKYQPMTTTEFLDSTVFEEYKLSHKVEDLSKLTMDDIDLDAEWVSMLFKETASFTKANELISMKFVIKESYFDKLADENKAEGIVYENGEGLVYDKTADKTEDKYKDGEGVRSVLEGDMIHIELAYGKLNNIIVYQYKDNDGVQTLEEVYRFSNVYKGPNIDIFSMDKIKKDYKLETII